MRCTLVLLSLAASKGFSVLQVFEVPGWTILPSLVRQQTWQMLRRSLIDQPPSLVCDCGNREGDFQAWRSGSRRQLQGSASAEVASSGA